MDDEGKKSENLAKNDGKNFLVKERYEIKFDEKIESLDNNLAKAYNVTDKIGSIPDLFALICSLETAPRTSILSNLKSIDHPAIMKLVDFGVITHPESKKQVLSLIYKKPLGGKVIDNLSESTALKNSIEDFKNCLRNLLSATEVIKGHSITHRSIRLDNLYYSDTDKTNIVIGDCAATFPGFLQPPAYETIENTICSPEGKGSGNDKDDIYSLGVCALNLLLGKELLKGITEPEAVRQKLKKGSYLTLCNEEKVPAILMNLFKGMLHDNDEFRWSYIQCHNFLDGKNNTFSNSLPSEKSQRSLIINGEKVYTAKNVAFALLKNREEGIELIKNGKLLEWIKNGIENEKLYIKVEKIINSELTTDNGFSNLVNKICILIAPSLPICIDDICIFPDGSPKAIFYAIKNQKNLAAFYNLFSSDLIKIWYQEQTTLRSPGNLLEFKMYINRKDFGYGLSRIMYDFDNDLPCISPLLGNEFVNTPARLIRALDNNYNNQTVPPYDNNIISYLRCKMGKKIEGILIDLNSNQENFQNAAIIRLYASMQNKFGPAKLENLCKWLAVYSKTIITSYHNIRIQKYLEKEVFKISKSGKISDLHDILENEDTLKKDKEEYSRALKDVHKLLQERNKILNEGYKLDEEAKDLAIRFASILAVLTMITSFIFNLINWALK